MLPHTRVPRVHPAPIPAAAKCQSALLLGPGPGWPGPGLGARPLLPPQPAAQLVGLLQAKIPRGGGAPPAARCRTLTEKPVCGLGSPRLDDGMERPGRSSRRPPPPPPGAVAAHSPPIDPQLWNFIY
uniref:uncharacterized protein LOC129515858 n=1 Tax=Nyctereutes procyonoides TaxID=34880 RepID=UPI002443B7A4|nr:uncharacterized protein LOC129515858 [Nyctereutes procyonoides]